MQKLKAIREHEIRLEIDWKKQLYNAKETIETMIVREQELTEKLIEKGSIGSRQRSIQEKIALVRR